MPSRAPIVVVTGLPRSGTSLLMRMLDFGGLDILTDGLRTADSDNPNGYYEFERVKRLPKGDVEWLDDAQGKAVKIIAGLAEHLPPTYAYRFILLRRDIDEVLASQRKMLIRRGEDPDSVPAEIMSSLLQRHLERARAALLGQPMGRLLEVAFSEAVSSPTATAHSLAEFLDDELDVPAMARAADPALYRNRAGQG